VVRHSSLSPRECTFGWFETAHVKIQKGFKISVLKRRKFSNKKIKDSITSFLLVSSYRDDLAAKLEGMAKSSLERLDRHSRSSALVKRAYRCNEKRHVFARQSAHSRECRCSELHPAAYSSGLAHLLFLAPPRNA
jgi:hypothetical protein